MIPALASVLMFCLASASVPARAAAENRPDPLPSASPRDGVGASSITLVSLPAELRAGDVVTVRWSEPGPDIEELEILLSVDDGRSFPLRVTPELDARVREYRWRVPDLPTAAARLRVRAGSEHAEIEGAPGAPFRITGPGAATRFGATVHEAGWWEGLSAPRAAGGCSLVPARATIHAAIDSAIASAEDRAPRDSEHEARGVLLRGLASTADRKGAPGGRHLETGPPRVPMRN